MLEWAYDFFWEGNRKWYTIGISVAVVVFFLVFGDSSGISLTAE